MPDLTTSSAIDTFMQSASNAAALANLGGLPLAGGTLAGSLTVGPFTGATVAVLEGDNEGTLRPNNLEFYNSVDGYGTTIQPGAISGNVTVTLPTTSGIVLTNNSNLPAGNLTGTVATARLGSGTADATTYLRGDGTWATVSGGGLTNITETFLTASPNNTVNVERLAVTGGTTNVDLTLTPKGSGASICGPAPDSTLTGGNKRGTYANDGQILRGSASQVASGSSSTIGGGQSNTASGSSSTVGGGQSNTASSTSSIIAGGASNTASGGSSSVGGGEFNTASGTASTIAGGQSNTASGSYSIASGYRSVSSLYAQFAHAAGIFSAIGDAQNVRFVMRNKTTTNSAVELFLDGSATRLAIPSGEALHATVKIIGIKSDGTSTAVYLRQFSIKNVAGTTSLVGTVNTVGSDTAAGTSISITANDTNDALKIEVTGVTSETWRWVATIDGVEVAYGV